MAKSKSAQRYIFKLNTNRLRNARWDLTLTLAEARKNEEIVSISNNQVLRWIDEMNGVGDVEGRVKAVYRQMRQLRREPGTRSNGNKLRKLYDELDKLLFKPDYLHLVIDKDKDLLRACKGFKVNGIKYVRLLGTSGGVKNSTVVFVSERLASLLRVRIDNGRNPNVPMVPAKLEAYRALTCSGTTPVSMPQGILVVPDCVTHFKEDIMYLSDENEGEPVMELKKDFEVELTESDGYGLMLPSLAARWSEELGLGYTMSACNTRWAYEKGMLFTFDFRDFADKVAGGRRVVKDVWGNDVDIGGVEVILTASMLKLWNSYDSLDHYLRCCEENHYDFCVAKVAPGELENRRTTNYQYLQVFDLPDDQLNELIQPTIDSIQDVLTGDYRKTLLFLCGRNMDEEKAEKMQPFVKALMAEPKMFADSYIKKRVLQMIRKRIDDAKIGVIDVHGNYSILCGDPYALCQSLFGLEVTGLLKAGEIYNKYWVDSGADTVMCFRAPMSCRANLLKRRVANTEEMAYWYQHITTCTLFNAWDNGVSALNGAD